MGLLGRLINSEMYKLLGKSIYVYIKLIYKELDNLNIFLIFKVIK